MAKSKQQIIEGLRKEIDRLTAENKELKELPRPENTETYTCVCGWNGTLDEMDALGSEMGCCPSCGNENLPTIKELLTKIGHKQNDNFSQRRKRNCHS
jgi:DNA repair exonuclease SbcCD ATPase subunit